MESAKKMILIDPRVLESLKANQGPPVSDFSSDSLREAGSTMRAILDTRIEPGKEHEHARALEQSLAKYLNRFDQHSRKPDAKVQIVSAPESSKDVGRGLSAPLGESQQVPSEIERRVLDSVPSSMQRKARAILDRMRESETVKYDTLGRLVLRDKTVQGSNIVDLMNDMLRSRKGKADPKGWEIFAQALKDINIEKELIGNSRRKQWMSESYDRAREPVRKRMSPLDISQKRPRRADSGSARDLDRSFYTPPTVQRKKLDWEQYGK